MVSFHSGLKSLGLRWLFILANSFNLTNVSVQVILFPLNLVLSVCLTFFSMESKRSVRTAFILLNLTLYDTYDMLLQWWLLILSKFYSNFPDRKTPSYWQNLISFNHLFSYYYLVSLHEKNRDDYLLTASQWLCKYVCKIFIRSLGPLLLFQVICWNAFWLYMLSCQRMPS